MKTKEVTFIVCKIFALYVLYQTIVYFSVTISSLYSGQFLSNIVVNYFLVFIFSFGLFLFFWFGADWLALKITNSRSEQDIKTNLTKDDILNIAFRVIGMLLLVRALPYMSRIVSLNLLQQEHTVPSLLPQFIEMFVLLVIGISLLLGADWFSKIIRKFRNW